MAHFPAGESRLFIDGPEGQLEAITTSPKGVGENEPGSGVVSIICHPHPRLEGTMNNKVVHTVARAHRDMGHRVVRFNFRGVEQSAGEYADGVGEVDDLLAVVDWVCLRCPEADIWLSGFSFGSFIAAQAVGGLVGQGISVERLLLIAPPVHYGGFAGLNQFPCAAGIIQGEEDEVVVPSEVYEWFGSLVTEARLEKLPGAGHFFHGKLTALKSLVTLLSS